MERVPQAPGWVARGMGAWGRLGAAGGRLGPGGLGAWGPGAWGPGARGRLGARRGLGAWAWPGGLGARRGHHAVARGGNCTIRATTRRRHAVKQLLMLQNPPPDRAEGATRTEQPSHDAWERLQRPRPRQLNHHERSLDSAAPPAAPTSDVPTRRVTGTQRSWLSGYRPRATTHPDRTPTSG